MAELLCVEKLQDRLAEADPVIFGDQRVLDNLIASEAYYIPKCNYFLQVQPDMKPFMRKVVATWMMEVCTAECCEDQVFPTAVNMLDRFLCECRIDKSQLQMIACVCLLLASKVRQCHSIAVEKLVYYSDMSVTAEQIRKFELVVLARLQWDTSSVTGFDFVDHVLERVTWSRELDEQKIVLVRRHARTLVDLCYCDPLLFRKSPALVGSGCLLAAVRGLKIRIASASSICNLTRCPPEEVENAVNYIDHLVAEQTRDYGGSERSLHAAPATASKTPAAAEEDHSHPETPTDVQEIFF